MSAIGASGSPARVIDTLRISAVPVPQVLAVSPGSRNAAVQQGSSAPGDNATVTLTGDNSSTTAWTASKRQTWTTLTTSSGTGSGTLAWSRNSSGLAAGTWVDTITVTLAGSGASAWVIDTMLVQPVGATLATNPRGRKHRALVSSGSSYILGPIADSAVVEGQVLSGESDVWIASATSSSLQLVTVSGHLAEWIHWLRIPGQVNAGLYIDTLQVTLQATPSVMAMLLDTLEIVDVATPVPSAGVDELFRPGAISDDQRTLLDRDGNNNGRYDLGDFLAWIDREHIRLTPAMVKQVQGLLKLRAGN